MTSLCAVCGRIMNDDVAKTLFIPRWAQSHVFCKSCGVRVMNVMDNIVPSEVAYWESQYDGNDYRAVAKERLDCDKPTTIPIASVNKMLAKAGFDLVVQYLAGEYILFKRENRPASTGNCRKIRKVPRKMGCAVCGCRLGMFDTGGRLVRDCVERRLCRVCTERMGASIRSLMASNEFRRMRF